MRVLILSAALLAAASSVAVAQTRDHPVRGHYRSNGTYVEPYRATNPNGTTLDNYGTRGNTNPYSGREGTRDPYSYGSGGGYGSGSYGSGGYGLPADPYARRRW